MKTLKELFGSFGSNTKEHETQSCCGGKDHSHQSGIDSPLKMVYQCPMKCEGGKTYDESGSCPKCNMQLKLKE